MKSYLDRVGISISILVNVLFGGKSNQTISATQWQRNRDGKYNICWLIDRIFWFDSDHCMGAWVKWKIIHTAINKNTHYKF
jgi:hypothetical protein